MDKGRLDDFLRPSHMPEGSCLSAIRRARQRQRDRNRLRKMQRRMQHLASLLLCDGDIEEILMEAIQFLSIQKETRMQRLVALPAT